MMGRIIFTLLIALASPAFADTPTRHFVFTRDVTIDGLGANDSVEIWYPRPPDTADQQIKEIPPHPPLTQSSAPMGNLFYYRADKPDAAGTIHFESKSEVIRRQATTQPIDQPYISEFLKPDRLVPINGKPMKLLDGLTLQHDPLLLGRQLFDVVEQNMEYRKDKPGWGRGDADWACDSHFGNCTDFHSLFISLARSENLPAKFEIGYAIPANQKSGMIAGYHCWAWFYVAGQGWVPVDISESKQTGVQQFGWIDSNRVLLSSGRDISLIPMQRGPRLNYFLNPYVEVNGVPLDGSHVHTTVTFDEIEANDAKLK